MYMVSHKLYQIYKHYLCSIVSLSVVTFETRSAYLYLVLQTFHYEHTHFNLIENTSGHQTVHKKSLDVKYWWKVYHLEISMNIAEHSSVCLVSSVGRVVTCRYNKRYVCVKFLWCYSSITWRKGRRRLIKLA